jgi:hypothetical protein
MKRIDAVNLSLTLALSALAMPATAKPKIIEFDPKHALQTGVLSNSPNSHGNVVGIYGTKDTNLAFIRKRNGKIAEIGQALVQPNPSAINARNTITGKDAHKHGFIIAQDGTTTSFDVTGSDGSGYGTSPRAIDSKGNIAGFYSEPLELNLHGFVRNTSGHFVHFDAPGAGTDTDQGTYALAIDPKFGVAGYCTDTNSVFHGFVRAPDGTFTMINIDGAGSGSRQGTVVAAINASGTTVGNFTSSDGAVHGFLRKANGEVSVIDVNGAGSGSGQGTVVIGINAGSVTTGYFVDPSGGEHGFVRSANGKITVIDAPDAAPGPGVGTVAHGINDDGEIAGYYYGSDQTYHGFFRTP